MNQGSANSTPGAAESSAAATNGSTGASYRTTKNLESSSSAFHRGPECDGNSMSLRRTWRGEFSFRAMPAPPGGEDAKGSAAIFTMTRSGRYRLFSGDFGWTPGGYVNTRAP